MTKETKTVAIYVRVSTDRQNVDMQLSELRDYAKKRGFTLGQEYIDHGYTGANTKRPAYHEMMRSAHRRDFDVLLIWKLDRLSRSMKDLITTLDELGALGIDFIALHNALDTSTPTGKLVFHVVGAVAEFERDIIRERVKAGLENARRKGKKLGRRPISPYLFNKAKELRGQGLSYYAIGKQLGIHESTIRKKMKNEETKTARLVAQKDDCE